MILQFNSIKKKHWLRHFAVFALLLFSLSSCEEDKIIVPEKASVTIEGFTDAVVVDEHFQNVLTIISTGLEGKVDESAVEKQLNILYNAEKTDYLRSMFDRIPVSGSSEEHAKAVFTRLNEKIAAEFDALYDVSEGATSTIVSRNKTTPCFDRLTNDRAAIQTTVLLCTGAAVIKGSYDGAWACQAIATVQLAAAYSRFHRCLQTNY